MSTCNYESINKKEFNINEVISCAEKLFFFTFDNTEINHKTNEELFKKYYNLAEDLLNGQNNFADIASRHSQDVLKIINNANINAQQPSSKDLIRNNRKKLSDIIMYHYKYDWQAKINHNYVKKIIRFVRKFIKNFSTKHSIVMRYGIEIITNNKNVVTLKSGPNKNKIIPAFKIKLCDSKSYIPGIIAAAPLFHTEDSEKKPTFYHSIPDNNTNNSFQLENIKKTLKQIHSYNPSQEKNPLASQILAENKIFLQNYATLNDISGIIESTITLYNEKKDIITIKDKFIKLIFEELNNEKNQNILKNKIISDIKMAMDGMHPLNKKLTESLKKYIKQKFEKTIYIKPDMLYPTTNQFEIIENEKNNFILEVQKKIRFSKLNIEQIEEAWNNAILGLSANPNTPKKIYEMAKQKLNAINSNIFQKTKKLFLDIWRTNNESIYRSALLLLQKKEEIINTLSVKNNFSQIDKQSFFQYFDTLMINIITCKPVIECDKLKTLQTTLDDYFKTENTLKQIIQKLQSSPIVKIIAMSIKLIKSNKSHFITLNKLFSGKKISKKEQNSLIAINDISGSDFMFSMVKNGIQSVSKDLSSSCIIFIKNVIESCNTNKDKNIETIGEAIKKIIKKLKLKEINEFEIIGNNHPSENWARMIYEHSIEKNKIYQISHWDVESKKVLTQSYPIIFYDNYRNKIITITEDSNNKKMQISTDSMINFSTKVHKIVMDRDAKITERIGIKKFKIIEVDYPKTELSIENHTEFYFCFPENFNDYQVEELQSEILFAMQELIEEILEASVKNEISIISNCQAGVNRSAMSLILIDFNGRMKKMQQYITLNQQFQSLDEQQQSKTIELIFDTKSIIARLLASITHITSQGNSSQYSQLKNMINSVIKQSKQMSLNINKGQTIT